MVLTGSLGKTKLFSMNKVSLVKVCCCSIYLLRSIKHNPLTRPLYENSMRDNTAISIINKWLF